MRERKIAMRKNGEGDGRKGENGGEGGGEEPKKRMRGGAGEDEGEGTPSRGGDSEVRSGRAEVLVDLPLARVRKSSTAPGPETPSTEIFLAPRRGTLADPLPPGGDVGRPVALPGEPVFHERPEPTEVKPVVGGWAWVAQAREMRGTKEDSTTPKQTANAVPPSTDGGEASAPAGSATGKDK